MFGISHIKVNAENKSKEEIKKEILEKVSKEVDDMFAKNKDKDKEVKKEENMKENQCLHMLLDENDSKTGFQCQMEIKGELGDLMNMLVCGTITALKEILGEKNPDVVKFVMQVMDGYAEEKDGEK